MTNISSKKKNTPCLKCDVVDHEVGLCECLCHHTHEEIMANIYKDTPTLSIKEIADKTGRYEQCWLFLSHQKPYENYNFRWMIAKNKEWIGLVSLFPATHKDAISRIEYEIRLAKEAIKLIEQGDWIN